MDPSMNGARLSKALLAIVRIYTYTLSKMGSHYRVCTGKRQILLNFLNSNSGFCMDYGRQQSLRVGVEYKQGKE